MQLYVRDDYEKKKMHLFYKTKRRTYKSGLTHFLIKMINSAKKDKQTQISRDGTNIQKSNKPIRKYNGRRKNVLPRVTGIMK